jgi:hypothetical protein
MNGPGSDVVGGVCEVTYARSNGSIIASSSFIFVWSVDRPRPHAMKLYGMCLRRTFLCSQG